MNSESWEDGEKPNSPDIGANGPIFFGYTSYAFHNKCNCSRNRYGNVRAEGEAMKIMEEGGLSLPPAEFEEDSSSSAGKINAL